jgi:signal transduction histidine kinase
MRGMINDLLNLSRIKRPGALSEVATGDIVVTIITEHEAQLKTNNIDTELLGTFPTVYTDQRKLEEIVRNLVSNAIKYMGKQPEPRITIGVEPKSHQYLFYVKDNGIGIEEKELSKIFQPFYSKSDLKIGSGVGLSIAKGFIEDLGGQIWVESQHGQGSTFWFSLPKRTSADK